jgi:hypothetical protein
VAADRTPAEIEIAGWASRLLREFRRELAAAADKRRCVALDERRVDRFARFLGPRYRLHTHRRGNGETVYAQVAETVEERVAAELVDLLRLAPQLSRCPRCGRVRVGRCRAYLARDGLVVETCAGRTSAPDLNEEERKLKEAMRKQAYRLSRKRGPSDPLALKARDEYLQRFPLAQRGPAAKVPRSSVLAEDRDLSLRRG